jgi:hypothetical protein
MMAKLSRNASAACLFNVGPESAMSIAAALAFKRHGI